MRLSVELWIWHAFNRRVYEFTFPLGNMTFSCRLWILLGWISSGHWCTMRTMLKFYLISRCENFVERRSFRRVSGELCGNYAFLQNFQTRKLGEINVFYVVVHKKFRRRSLNILHCKKIKKVLWNKFAILCGFGHICWGNP